MGTLSFIISSNNIYGGNLHLVRSTPSTDVEINNDKTLSTGTYSHDNMSILSFIISSNI